MPDANLTSSGMLSKISAAKNALSKASTMDEVLDIRDKAEAIRVYMRASRASLEVQNQAADIRLRAERKAGELLANLNLNSVSKVKSDSVSLSELGVTKKQSSRWQMAARLPDEDYEILVSKCNEFGCELTQSAVLSAARAISKRNEPKEQNEDCVDEQKLGLFELIAEVRSTVTRWKTSFDDLGESSVLIEVIKSELV